ncbi:MAG: pyruvate kinase alpha/beta domain-containing protein [Armatimonadota bacterium]
MESTVIYHDAPGPDNTAETLDVAVNAASVYQVETVVVASRSGATAMDLMERIEGTDIRMVVVTPQFGWMDEHEFDWNLIPTLREAGHEFHAGTMPFHTDALHGCSAPKRMGDVLRIFSQGVQVCVEIAMMAADGGLLKCDRRCVVVAGTGRGADTAMVVTPASSAKLEDFRVHEILCKPRLMPED